MIEIQGLIVKLPDFSLGPITFTIDRGQFFVILGPSGAGKTVLLETIAGIYRPSAGRITIDGRDVTHLPPEKREVGMVYQDYALFPHLSVRANIEYGLKLGKVPRNERRRRAEEIARLLGIDHLLDRLPETLSGGEQQRVALARALAPRPRVVLLDEPLSALDPQNRARLSWELKKINRQTGVTFLMVTHDVREALLLGDTIAFVREGKIEQIGSPEDFLRCPAGPSVIEFFGLRNVFKARFRGREAEIDGLRLLMGEPARGKEGFVAIRPDDIVLSREPLPSSARNRWKGKVVSLLDVGTHIEVRTQVGPVEVLVFITRAALEDLALREGEEVFLSFKAMAVESIGL